MVSGVADSGGKIEELEDRISQLEAARDELEVSAEKLTKEKEVLEEKVLGLEENNTELSEKNTDLQDKLRDLETENEDLKKELDEVEDRIPVSSPALAVEGRDIEVRTIFKVSGSFQKSKSPFLLVCQMLKMIEFCSGDAIVETYFGNLEKVMF